MLAIMALPTITLADGINYKQTLAGGATCNVQLYRKVVYGSPTIVFQPVTTCFTGVEICPITKEAMPYSKCVTTPFNMLRIVPDGTPDTTNAVLVASWTVDVPAGGGLMEEVNWKMGYGVSVSCE